MGQKHRLEGLVFRLRLYASNDSKMSDRKSLSRSENCKSSNFDAWIAQQEADLDELLRALPISAGANMIASVDQLRELVSKAVERFVEYSERRHALLVHDPPAFVCPFWCSTFVNLYLWLGRCRPTMFVRLVYAQSGSELNAHLEEFLAARAWAGVAGGSGGMIALSPGQLTRVNDLQGRTIREEERLTSRLAALQEEIGDTLLFDIVSERNRNRAVGSTSTSANGNGTGEARNILEQYSQKLGRLVKEADDLRVTTMKDLVADILTPQKAVEFLAAGKQLHLSVHAWGLNRDRERRHV